MEETKYSKALKEIYVLLNASTYDIIEKLPDEFKEYILDKMDDNYDYTIEYGKPLIQQKMMPETKIILKKIFNLYLSD